MKLNKEYRINKIDSRVKLMQIIISGILIFALHNPIISAMHIAFLTGTLIYLRVPTYGLKLMVYYLVILFVFFVSTAFGHIGIFSIIALISYLLKKLAPAVGIYYLFSKAMTVSEFLDALERMKFPRLFIIPMAVTLRFFPTIGLEIGMIKDAMRMRGKPFNFIVFIREPIKMMEYVVVPLMARCIKISDELSASAVARGIENPDTRTSRIELKIKYKDILYLFFILITAIGMILWEAMR